jgi:hypothetical protein
MILGILHVVALRPAENKETGGSPFAPCEIRRSINRKIHNSPLA